MTGAEKAVNDFFSSYRPRLYKKGQILILSGDDTDYIYYLVKGRVKQYDVSYRGDEIIVNVYKPLAFFPMSLAVNKTGNNYIYEAETDVELRQAPAADTLKFVKSNPEVMFDLLSRVYRGVDGLLARLTHIMKSSAKERLMYEILIHAKRFGKLKADGSIVSTINESEIGGRAGLSRETVSREMQKLVKSKLVSLKAGKLTVHNPTLFERKLDPMN